jgi:anthranilate synthase component 2
MIVLIGNYDSFTFNLFHYLGGLGADVVVYPVSRSPPWVMALDGRSCSRPGRPTTLASASV